VSYFRLKCAKIRFRLGLRPRPRWGAYSAPPDPYLVGRGLAAPPQEPQPCLGLRPRFFSPSGFRLRHLRRLVVPPSTTTIPPQHWGGARIHTGKQLNIMNSIHIYSEIFVSVLQVYQKLNHNENEAGKHLLTYLLTYLQWKTVCTADVCDIERYGHCVGDRRRRS